jgi:acyl-CoA synthetase (AMP-forming)/AMP-acid ligase II
MSLAIALRNAYTLHAERIALRFKENAWTYAELDRISDALATGLWTRGIRAGDRVAFLLPNGFELVSLNLACIKLGAVAVPLNVRLTGAELAYVLNHCMARMCIAHASLYSALEPLDAELPFVEARFLVGADRMPANAESFDNLLAAPQPRSDWPFMPGTAPAAILYTSGTTARPKGVTHTYGSLGNTIRQYVQASGLAENDVVLGMLSMAHIFGFTLQLLAPLSAGATVIVTPSFDPEGVLALVAGHGVTHLYGLPVMFDALTRYPAAHSSDCSSLRYCLAGGDAVTPTLSERMRAVLGVDLYEGCGMTEVIPYCLNRPALENRVGSIGRPSVGMEVRLVGEAGVEAPSGEVGEMLVRSDALMAGYWDDPAATAEAINEGWFRTGDLGRCDEAGYYWFVGRRKEIIVRGGSNISPLEVEAVLSRHPDVREAAVVGAPDPVLGETVAAFVVLKDGASLSADELRSFGAGQIATYKLPESITFLPDLPRGMTGKVNRKALKERAAQK